MSLSFLHEMELIQRGIDPTLATSMGIYSGSHSPDGSGTIVPDPETGAIMCLPFIEHGKVVNIKFRKVDEAGGKRMWQVAGGAKTPYNVDVILDPHNLDELGSPNNALVWTEGELDCVSAVQAGWKYTVSLPEGAVAARDAQGRKLPSVPEDTRDIDPENDDKFAFFQRHEDAIQAVRLHILAMDADEAGQRMAKEMARRLGPARCLRIIYPTEQVVPDKDGGFRACKDLNEVLQCFDADRVMAVLKDARPWPVKGLYKLSDYPDEPDPETYEGGISQDLDAKVRLYPGAFMVVTGVPGSGKSTLINQWAVMMAKHYRWPVTIFSGEMPTKPHLVNPLMTAFLGKPKREWTQIEKQVATEFVENYFTFIDYCARADEEEANIDVDFIIDKGAAACFRHGTRLLVIDPWNELEHGRRPPHMNHSEYIGNCIRKLKRFAKEYECAVIVVTHPSKMMSDTSEPNLYNIADSANWANKAEIGLIVHIPTAGENEDPYAITRRQAIIRKIKFPGTGEKGLVELEFDKTTNLFLAGDPMREPSGGMGAYP